MQNRFTYRSAEKEIMDDLSLEGETLRKTLNQIALINKRLGGNKATLDGLITLLGSGPENQPLCIADLGCGNGDMLRAIADHGRRNGHHFLLLGIDANEFTVNYARELSVDYPEISYRQLDVLSAEFQTVKYDIAIATFFLHHFTHSEIECLVEQMVHTATRGIVINDLHRSRMAYYGFRLISLFISNPMVRKDGAISVLRGFKKRELLDLSKKIKDAVSSIRWKWAFRYLWIMKKQ